MSDSAAFRKRKLQYFHEKYRTKNLSLGGMLIESQRALEVGKSIQMELFLLGDEHIYITGRVASCNVIAGETRNLTILGQHSSIFKDNIKNWKRLIQLLQNLESDFSVGGL